MANVADTHEECCFGNHVEPNSLGVLFQLPITCAQLAAILDDVIHVQQNGSMYFMLESP